MLGGGVVGGGTVLGELVPLGFGGASGLLGGRLLRPLEEPVVLCSPEPPVAELGDVLLPVLVPLVPVESLLSPEPVGAFAELSLVLVVPEPPLPCSEEVSLADLSPIFFDLDLDVVVLDELSVLVPELPVLPEVCADTASGMPAARQPNIAMRLSHRVVMYLSPLVFCAAINR